MPATGAPPSDVLQSFTIGTLFGIKIRVHALFLLLPALILLTTPLPLVEVALWILVLCGVLLLHELGHSLTAQRFGIRVMDITFWPLGGMARMSQIPEDSKIEGLIAIAGPAVNFALMPIGAAAVFAGKALGWNGLAYFGATFVGINVVLGVFNLIPAFPMDGGRVLRAFLARKGDWVTATERAVHVGRMIALLGGLVAFFNDIYLAPLIAVWLWFAGGQELRAVRMRHAQSPMGDLGAFVRAAFGEAAARAAAQSAPGAHGGPGSSARYAHYEPAREPRSAEPAPRPPSPPSTPPNGHGTGITDADVERLERFRGPLRQFRIEDE